VNLTISIVNSVHGRPAEGVDVCVVSDLDGVHVVQAQGRTGAHGEFRCTDLDIASWDGQSHRIEIDVESYFATFGITSWNRRLAVFFRAFDLEHDQQVSCQIAPFAQASFVSCHEAM
jgi:5-hydroxyisourate hydrolase-like protein (transthyretin family)